MGQKVSPVGMRVGINKQWNSRWYAEKEYAKFLNEDIEIRKYLVKECKAAKVSHVEIERFNAGESALILIHAALPGQVIGAEGAHINAIKEKLSKMVTGDFKVEVVEVKNPDLDATIIAQDIALQLEDRASFRTVQKKAIQRVRRAGAKGIKTSVSGRLGGADIARAEGYREGVIPLHTLRSDIDYACTEAATQYGRLGVKVWICRGEIRPELAKKAAKGE